MPSRGRVHLAGLHDTGQSLDRLCLLERCRLSTGRPPSRRWRDYTLSAVLIDLEVAYLIPLVEPAPRPDHQHVFVLVVHAGVTHGHPYDANLTIRRGLVSSSEPSHDHVRRTDNAFAYVGIQVLVRHRDALPRVFGAYVYGLVRTARDLCTCPILIVIVPSLRRHHMRVCHSHRVRIQLC